MRTKRNNALLFLLLLAGLSAFGQGLRWKCDVNDVPPRSEGLVIQYRDAKLFSKGEEDQLDKKLQGYEDTTSNQIVVVVVPNLCGEDPNKLGTDIGHAWGVGNSAEKDNGVVVLIKPRTGSSSTQRGQVSIQVGYGLEGVITDAMTKRVIDRIIIPNFKNGDFYRGIDRATDALISMASGEFDGTGTESFPFGVLVFVLIIVVIIIIIAASKNSGGGPTTTYSGRGWSTGRRGGWTWTSGSSSWGSGGGFGGGGGSFGGFGGGGFGGGGASGSW